MDYTGSVIKGVYDLSWGDFTCMRLNEKQLRVKVYTLFIWKKRIQIKKSTYEKNENLFDPVCFVDETV